MAASEAAVFEGEDERGDDDQGGSGLLLGFGIPCCWLDSLDDDVMPIVRTYACPDCNHIMDVVLSADYWEAPPPDCPACKAREMRQDFRPVAIGGSNRARAVALAEDIAAKDYNVADMKVQGREGGTPTVRYKDQTAATGGSSWVGAQGMLEQAISIGRQTRMQHGSGLDVLQSALKSGAQPDLIAESRKRMIKVW